MPHFCGTLSYDLIDPNISMHPVWTDVSMEESEPDNIRPIIYRYHSDNRPIVAFYQLDEKGNTQITDCSQEQQLYLGFELEFDSRLKETGMLKNKKSLIRESNKLFDNRTYIYYMNDGSLHHGLEMISQPATYEYHLSLYDIYKELFKKVAEHGFKSQSYQSCGLHIHFNKDFYYDNIEKNTVNLLYLIETFWKDLVLLSRRNYNSIIRWAQKYPKHPKQTYEDFKGRFFYSHRDRYYSLNLTNYNTYEFRIYRGTLNIDDFFATLELTYNLINLAKTKTATQLKKISWNDIVNTSDRLREYNKKCHRATAIRKLPDNLK